MKTLTAIAAAALSLTLATAAQAGVVLTFADNFEAGLSGWTQRDPNSPTGVIVADPLNSSNHVLAFNRLEGGGSIFSTTRVSSTSGAYSVSFDYLGMPGRGGVAGDLGGYLGVQGPNGEMWLAGTGSYPTPIGLTDDGLWHRYTYAFVSTAGQPLQLKMEDWNGSGGVAGDAYFDNVQINDLAFAPVLTASAVPEPASLALVSLGLLAAGAASRRRRV